MERKNIKRMSNPPPRENKQAIENLGGTKRGRVGLSDMLLCAGTTA